MAYREVTMIEVKEVLRQWLSGVPKKRVARRVGVARNTVREYIAVAEECGLCETDDIAVLTDERMAAILVALKGSQDRPRGEAWAKCQTQRTFIEQRLKQGLKLTKIRKLLIRQGIVVPYWTLYRFASTELAFGSSAPTIPVADCAPGEELQLDTGWMGLLEPDDHGKRRRYRAWIFTSVCTRHRFVYPSFHETTAEAIEACEAAWAFFGGVFRVLIPDNTKAIVARADPLDPLINRTFLEYAQTRGFVIDPTRAKHPKDKARVERAVQPTRDDCFAGETLRSILEARAHGRQWCLADYGMRRHTRTQRLPLEHFEAEEKARLLPAPTVPYDIPLWCEPKVAPDQHAQVAKALYSLPFEYRRRKVLARADRTTVRFYNDAGVVFKMHPRMPPGGRSTDPADFPAEKAAYALRDVAFLEAQAQKHGHAVGRFAKELLAGPLPWTRMRRVYALLGLARRYGSKRLDDTCALALAADMLDVHRLKRMLELGPPPTSAISTAGGARVIPLCRYLRPSQQYTLPLFSTQRDNPNQGELS
jgi:transposase